MRFLHWDFHGGRDNVVQVELDHAASVILLDKDLAEIAVVQRFPFRGLKNLSADPVSMERVQDSAKQFVNR